MPLTCRQSKRSSVKSWSSDRIRRVTAHCQHTFLRRFLVIATVRLLKHIPSAVTLWPLWLAVSQNTTFDNSFRGSSHALHRPVYLYSGVQVLCLYAPWLDIYFGGEKVGRQGWINRSATSLAKILGQLKASNNSFDGGFLLTISFLVPPCG